MAYAIGVAEPVSIMVDTFGTGKVPTGEARGDDPRATSTSRPPASSSTSTCAGRIYRKTAAYGHFGRSEPEFTWERTDRVKDLRDDAGV